MKNSKNILIFMLVIIIVIIIIVIALINTLKDNIVHESKSIKHIELNKLDEVTDREEYFTINTILNTYYTNINYLEANIEDLEVIEVETDEEKEEIIKEYTQQGIKALQEILDDESIDYLNLNDSKILNLFKKYKNDTYKIEKLYFVEKDINIKVYYIKLIIDNQKESNIIVKTDSYNETFSIYPEEYLKEKSLNENSIEEYFDTDNIEYIEENDTNKYEVQEITDELMAQYYLYDYGDKVVNNIEQAYNSIEENYKEKRYPTLESYKDYIQNSEKRYQLLELRRYSMQEYEDYTEYTCEDQYGNKYVFKDKNIMNYTVQLDAYTLENEEFREKYKKSNNKEKGILNIDKFFQMLNMEDYESAYNVIDDGFKQNYYQTQADFENYIKQHTFKYNKVAYTQYSNKISSLHTYNIEITDLTGNSGGVYKLTIIEKLLDDINFSLSFEVE